MTHIAKSRHDLAEELRQLAYRTLDVANNLHFYSGYNQALARYSQQLISDTERMICCAIALNKPNQQPNQTRNEHHPHQPL